MFLINEKNGWRRFCSEDFASFETLAAESDQRLKQKILRNLEVIESFWKLYLNEWKSTSSKLRYMWAWVIGFKMLPFHSPRKDNTTTLLLLKCTLDILRYCSSSLQRYARAADWFHRARLASSNEDSRPSYHVCEDRAVACTSDGNLEIITTKRLQQKLLN